MKGLLLFLLWIPLMSSTDEITLPTRGSLAFSFELKETLYPAELPHQKSAPKRIPLIRTPLFEAEFDSKARVVQLDLQINRIEGKGPIPRHITRTMLNHVKGGQRYHLNFSWDIEADRFDVYLNGTLQEHISNIQIPYWEDGLPPLKGELELFPSAEIQFGDWTLLPEVGEGETLPAALAEQAATVPPMSGESRTLYREGLSLEGLKKKLIFASDFSDSNNIEREEDLFSAGTRSRQPQKDWLVEATGTARIEENALILESQPEVELQRWEHGKPNWEPGKHQKHVVVWLTRRMPENLLVEYTMEPVDSRQGLHILFFAAHGPENGSIFQPGLKAREGDFRNYIFNPDEFQSYHISWWSSPQTADRRSSNLRKNNNFYLLTSGDDRINRKGERPYRIRLLKQGGHIQGEVDGVKVIDYHDEGKIFGPVFRDGYLGWRMMGESKKITIRDIQVWEVE